MWMGEDTVIVKSEVHLLRWVTCIVQTLDYKLRLIVKYVFYKELN